MDIARFKKLPLLCILRGIDSSSVEPLVETIISARIETIEITMNTQGAEGLIKKAVQAAKRRLMVGAGTVLSVESLKKALDAGATFAVMPARVDEVMKYCRKNKIPAFPGALTPQEIYTAWNSGATMVKVFPATCFGPKYFQYLKGPFPAIPLMAVGGLTQENIAEYFACGAQAVAIGESVFKKEEIDAGNFKLIKKSLVRLVEALKLAIKK